MSDNKRRDYNISGDVGNNIASIIGSIIAIIIIGAIILGVIGYFEEKKRKEAREREYRYEQEAKARDVRARDKILAKERGSGIAEMCGSWYTERKGKKLYYKNKDIREVEIYDLEKDANGYLVIFSFNDYSYYNGSWDHIKYATVRFDAYGNVKKCLSIKSN